MEKYSVPGCPLDEQRPLAKLLPHQNVNKMRKNWSQVTKKVPKVRLEDFTNNPKKTNTTRLLLLRHDSKTKQEDNDDKDNGTLPQFDGWVLQKLEALEVGTVFPRKTRTVWTA